MLRGRGGDDYLQGGEGNDILDGGSGDNTANYYLWDGEYYGTPQGVTVSLATTGPQNTGQGVDTLSNIQHLTGTYLDDTLIGNGFANLLIGAQGNDTLDGNGGTDDGLVGGQGNDTYIVRSVLDSVIENPPTSTAANMAANRERTLSRRH